MPILNTRNTGGSSQVTTTRAAVAVLAAGRPSVVTARSTDTGGASGARRPTAADTGVTRAAGVAVTALAVAATLITSPRATVCDVTGAAHRSRARAVATAKSDTADLVGFGIRTLTAQSFAMRTIAGALTCGRCIGTEHGRAKFRTIAVARGSAREVGLGPLPEPAESGANTG